MNPLAITRPELSEHAPYYERYISLVAGDDALAALQTNIRETASWLAGLPSSKEHHRYAPGKWSVLEAVGHMIDTERIFAYRALRFSRNDKSPLPSFEQDDFTREGPYENCSLKDLVEEFQAVRATTVMLFRNLPPDALTRRGVASGNEMTVRAAAWVMAGHELHHMRVLKEKYV